MINPFQIIHYRGSEYFCDREEETNVFVSALENGRSVTLFSIRRMGKTALIHHVLNMLNQRKESICIYLDIYDTQTEKDFVNAISSAVLRSIEKDKEGFIQQIGKFFSRYRPQISFDVLTGNPNVSMDIRNSEDMEFSLEALFSIIRAQKKPVFLAIDEFQEIDKYPDSRLAATLRKHLQNSTNLSVIFSGSKRNMITNLFTNPKLALYRTTQLFELDKIPEAPYITFIQFHFKQGARKIDKSNILKILDWTSRHTYYTQYFCHRLFEAGIKKINRDSIEEIKNKILKENEMVFYNYRRMLSPQQWKLLKAIGVEGLVKEPTSAAFIQKYTLGAHSTVRLSLEKLLAIDMIFEHINENTGKSEYSIYDVFLGRWIQWKFETNSEY